MSEVAEILDAISALEGRGENMALATIVDVRGSTYRRPGARLVMSGDGKMVGNLSGGCLEGEVQEVALSVMKEARARTAFYDLTADDEVVWGWGLGCNGAIEVFIEPAAKAIEIAGALRGAIEEQRPVAVGTVLESSVPDVEPGDRLLAEREEVSGRLADDEAHARLAEVVVEALSSGVTEVRELSVRPGDLRVFIESIQPPLRLLVCGAGHDAMPLVRLAVSLGWNVDVLDDRRSMLNEDRFPGVRSFIESAPADAAVTARVDGRTNVVVMSHNYLRDRDYLKSFVASDAAYVGMLGPRARLERLLGDLATEGINPSNEQRNRLHGPAGLDVGAEGPEEIAAAIVGEILAVSRQREGGFLRERAGPIHGRQPAEASS
jgi:xanthine/CO dehydrogenase XdhC/CoxF family maturation factor